MQAPALSGANRTAGSRTERSDIDKRKDRNAKNKRKRRHFWRLLRETEGLNLFHLSL